MHEPLDAFEQRFPWRCTTTHSQEEVEPWLMANIGEFDRDWYRYGTDIAQGIVAGAPLYDYYRFRDYSDAVLFLLRWA